MTDTLTPLEIDDLGGERRARRAADQDLGPDGAGAAAAPQYLPSVLSVPGAPAPATAQPAARTLSFEEVLGAAPASAAPAPQAVQPQYLPVPVLQQPVAQLPAPVVYAAPPTTPAAAPQYAEPVMYAAPPVSVVPAPAPQPVYLPAQAPAAPLEYAPSGYATAPTPAPEYAPQPPQAAAQHYDAVPPVGAPMAAPDPSMYLAPQAPQQPTVPESFAPQELLQYPVQPMTVPSVPVYAEPAAVAPTYMAPAAYSAAVAPVYPAQPVSAPPAAPDYAAPAALGQAPLGYSPAPVPPLVSTPPSYEPEPSYQLDSPAASRGLPVPLVSPSPNEVQPMEPNAYTIAPAFPPHRAYTPEPFAEVPEGQVASPSPYGVQPIVPAVAAPVVVDSRPAELDLKRDPSLRSDADLDDALESVRVMGGSDLHIAINSSPMIRIDGGLRALDGVPVWDADKVETALHSILTPEQRAKFESELELDFAYTLSANARFRVNIYQQRDNLGAAFRLIPTEIKTLKALGVPESIADFATLARGLVLITGPTGSGKSTTLAGLIDLVNRTRADHIMTVEDPIEFLHQNQKSLVNQREVGHDTHSFGQALKHVLRQDPDVILVGELRDLETISVALTAAETGHLVFATLHTSDAPQTIDRIIDVYPSHQQSQVRSQLAATLQGVVCQTLVKKASGKGRVVATEVLVRTGAVANLIREGKTFQIHSAMQAGRELGMHTLDQHLADLVNTGQITMEAAREKAHDLDVLARLVTGSRPSEGGQIGDGGNYSADRTGGH